MNRILIILVFQFVCLINLWASDNIVRKLIVEVRVTYDNAVVEKAYGLIYSEKQGKLTIITVSEIFSDQNYKDIQIYLENETLPVKAHLFANRSFIGYSVLQIETPPNFQWPGEIITIVPELNYQTIILGRDGNFDEYSKDQFAYIKDIKDFRFEMESSSNIEGKIGLPVINNNNIIGITKIDLGERIIAIPLSTIHYYCRDTLEIKSDNYLIGNNNIIFGAYSELPSYLSKYYSKNTYQRLHLINGIYVEFGIFSKLSLRLAYNYNYAHTSRNYLVYEDYVQTKTDLGGFSAFVVFKDPLSNSQKYVTYTSLGFSRKKQDFSMRINNGNWEPFEKYKSAEITLPGYCNIYTFEYRARTFLFNNVIGEAITSFNYLDKNHFVVNPFSRELIKNRFSLNFGISISYIIMNKKTFKNYLY